MLVFTMQLPVRFSLCRTLLWCQGLRIKALNLFGSMFPIGILIAVTQIASAGKARMASSQSFYYRQYEQLQDSSRKHPAAGWLQEQLITLPLNWDLLQGHCIHRLQIISVSPCGLLRGTETLRVGMYQESGQFISYNLEYFDKSKIGDILKETK